MDKYDFTLDIDSKDSNAIIINTIKPNSIILEFGPYKGRMTKYLKEKLNCKVFAVEIDKDAAKVCSQYTEKIIVQDIEKYGWVEEFKDIKFDNIIFADVLEHLNNPKEVLIRAKSLLKHDGSINISIPNITHDSIILNMCKEEFKYTPTGILDNTHLRFFGYNNLIDLIYSIGMETVREEATYCKPGENEINSKYTDVSMMMQQELKRRRRYGNVYQFVVEIKKHDYIKNNSISKIKNIKSNIQNIELLSINVLNDYTKPGDIYYEYNLNMDKCNSIRLNTSENKIDYLELNFSGEEYLLKIDVFGIINQERKKLKCMNSINNFFIVDNNNKNIVVEVKENYQEIELKISSIYIDKNFIKSRLELEIDKTNRIIELEQRIKKEGLLEEKVNSMENEKQRLLETINQRDYSIDSINKNIQYLSEELKNKDRQLSEIVNTKGWIILDKLRAIRNKILKYTCNPKLILYKISRKSDLKGKNEILDKASDDLITVVIPIYNRTTELIESIESILNQTYKNLELILVCDGSPRETIDIVDSYKDNPRVRIYKFYNNSGNAVRGRNKAIREARGNYLAFQDSDDIAEPNRLELSLKYMKKYKADVVYGGWRAKIDGTRKVDNLEDGQEVMSPDCDYDFLKKICVPCQSTVMVKIDALRDVGGLKEKMRYREDHELWLRLSYYGYKFKSIQKVLTNLRLHENNLELTFKDNDKHWEELTMSEHKTKNIMKPKIGYIIAGCDISGGLSVICKYANELLYRGYDVTLISTNGDTEINWYPEQKVEIITIQEVENNYDILIATFWITAYDLRRLSAKRKIYFVQSDESKFYNNSSKEYKQALETYKMDYEFITMANWIKEWLEREFGKRSDVILNGIDTNIMYKTQPILPKKNKLRILIEGPINVPFKGVEKAFKIVKDLDCEVWCVSSEGKLKPEWKCDMFFEKVPFEKMKEIYSSCDVLLKMSEVESFCLPALEIMACGGIPIVAEVNGIEEFLIDGVNGFIIKQGDLDTPKKIIRNLIENPEELKKIKEEACKTAKKMTWDKSIDKLEMFLNSK